MKTKLLLKPFGGIFGILEFDEKSFLITFLDFNSYWNYRRTNAIHVDSLNVYTSEKIVSLSKIDKTHLKCDVIDGSVLNGVKQSILYTFA